MKNNKKTLEQTVSEMLTENTGTHMLDSGGANNRHWQRNQGKTPADFQAAPAVTWELDHEATDSKGILYTVDTFHYLTSGVLELDELCHEFNALPVNDWDGDIAYGVSRKGARWLQKNGLTVSESWNTYNGDSTLSQVLQGTSLHLPGDSPNFGYPDYILLQVHGGADVRGGYTDAKLFKVNDYLNPCPDVRGRVNGTPVDSHYDGLTLLDESHSPVPLGDTPEIELGLSDCEQRL